MDSKPNWAAQIFLMLHPAAVGCLLGALILDPGGETRVFIIVCVTVALIFAVAGAAAPVLRIKKPLRSYRFLAGVGHSPLGRQAALVGLFTLLLLVYWILVLAGVEALWLGILAVVMGAAAVLAAGLVYLLGSQPGWNHWSTPLALFGGLLALGVSTSLVIALGWRDALLGGAAGALVARVLVLVGIVALETAIRARVARAAAQGRWTEDPRARPERTGSGSATERGARGCGWRGGGAQFRVGLGDLVSALWLLYPGW